MTTIGCTLSYQSVERLAPNLLKTVSGCCVHLQRRWKLLWAYKSSAAFQNFAWPEMAVTSYSYCVQHNVMYMYTSFPFNLIVVDHTDCYPALSTPGNHACVSFVNTVEVASTVLVRHWDAKRRFILHFKGVTRAALHLSSRQSFQYQLQPHGCWKGLWCSSYWSHSTLPDLLWFCSPTVESVVCGQPPFIACTSCLHLLIIVISGSSCNHSNSGNAHHHPISKHLIFECATLAFLSK